VEYRPCMEHLFLLSNVFNITTFVPTGYQIFYYSYIFPAISFVVFISNSLMIITFLKGRYFSVTHIWLFGIAIADILTTIIPSYIFLNHLTAKRYLDIIPYDQCIAIIIILLFVTPICHGISIWVTTCFAVHRYFVVSHPQYNANRLSFKWYALFTITVISAVVPLLFIDGFLILNNYPRINVYFRYGNSTNPTATITTLKYPINVSNVEFRLKSMYISRLIFLQIIPCMIAAFFGLILIKNIILRTKEAGDVALEVRVEKEELRRFNILSVFLLLSFLIVELPVTACSFMITVKYTLKIMNGELSLFFSTCLLLLGIH